MHTDDNDDRDYRVVSTSLSICVHAMRRMQENLLSNALDILERAKREGREELRDDDCGTFDALRGIVQALNKAIEPVDNDDELVAKLVHQLKAAQ